MQNFASISPDRSRTAAIELFRLWDVDEDSAYQVERVWDGWDGPGSTMPTAGRTGLCAVRTISGQGRVTNEDGESQLLGPDSFAVVPWLELAAWGTSAEAWRFYWFEFFADPAEALTHRSAVQVTAAPREREEIVAIQSQIRSRHEPTRMLASARFAAMLYHWLEQASEKQTRHKRQSEIDRVIELMHSSVDRQLSIAEMAEHAGLAVRSFTSAFEQTTGQTPKRYHLNLRLDAARALLLSGRANVKQAAERLGFSSPFYLSKLYSKRYGHPPSQAH